MFLARYEDSSLALLPWGQLKVGCQVFLQTALLKKVLLASLTLLEPCFYRGYTPLIYFNRALQPQPSFRQNIKCICSKTSKIKILQRPLHGSLFKQQQQPVYLHRNAMKEKLRLIPCPNSPSVLHWRVTLGCGGRFCCTPDKAIRVPPDGY